MADIFISYKREERRTAERLSIALEQLGFDVWWDFDLMSGDRFRNTIRAVIDQCPAAIVLWSARAIESDFVMDEATYAKSKGKLCPARLDAVELPFGFGQVHADDLSDWDGELSHPGFQGLVRALETRVGRKAKLGSARRDVQAQAQAAELDAFKAAQLANNQSALTSFLKDYPRGMFAGFVRGQLESMRVDAPASASGAAPRATLADFGGDGGASSRPAATPYRPAPRDTSVEPPPKKAPPYPLIGGVALVAAIAAYFVLKPKPVPEEAPAPAEVVETVAPAAPAAPAPAPGMNASDRAEIESLREQLAAQQQVTQQLAAQQEAAQKAAQTAQQQALAAQQQAAAQRAQPNAPAAPAAPAVTGFSTANLTATLRAAVENGRAAETRAVAAAALGRSAAQQGNQSGVEQPNSGYGIFNGTGDFAGDRYAGAFSNGSRSGYGVYTYGRPNTNSTHCEGQYANSQRNGSVVCYYRNGSRFSGDYKNADRNGYGVYRFADGRRDEGEYADGNLSGYGVSWTADGRVSAAGIWKDGKLVTPVGPQGQ